MLTADATELKKDIHGFFGRGSGNPSQLKNMTNMTAVVVVVIVDVTDMDVLFP